MPDTTIHPTAVIDERADLGPGVEIGPYAIIQGPVRLGEGVKVLSHAIISGPAEIGAGTTIYPHAAIGFPPQDFKFAPGSITAGVVIGRDCLIREHATVHAASNDHTPTRLGDRVFLMVNAHIGHDCQVGDHVILVNNACLAGHCIVGERANISGAVVAHQHCRIGRLAMIAGGSALSADIPPFCIHSGRNLLVGINQIGLRRNGFAPEHITQIRAAFRHCFRVPVPTELMLERLREMAKTCPPIGEMADFVASSKRGICPGSGRALRPA